MDVSSSLLVAVMFVIILSMGIGHILVAAAAMVDRRVARHIDALHVNWMLLLLLIYFNLFWHTLDLLTTEEWGFASFLYIMAGAILIYFATYILLPEMPPDDSLNLRAYYFEISRQFFLMLALLQAWIIGVDVLLGTGFTSAGVINLMTLLLALLLASSRKTTVHVGGTVVAWVLFLAAAGLRSLGVI